MRSLRLLALLPMLALAACVAGGGAVAPPGDGGQEAADSPDAASLSGSFRLTEISAGPPPAPVTLTFPEPGRVAGRAPCNSFTGPLLQGPPAFRVGPLAVTTAACAEQDAERAFFDVLDRMERIEFTETGLILSSGVGERMVFVRE